MNKSAICTTFTLLAAATLLTACKGKAGPQGPMGTSYNPPGQLCSNPSKLGYSGTAQNSGLAGNRIFATAVTLVASTTGISMSYYVPAGPVTGQIRLGIYGDSGANYPNALVAQTNPFTPTLNTWNTLDIADVFLPAGTYWVAFQFSNDNSSHSIAFHAAGLSYYADFPWGVLPQTYPGAGSSFANEPSLYVNTCP